MSEQEVDGEAAAKPRTGKDAANDPAEDAAEDAAAAPEDTTVTPNPSNAELGDELNSIRAIGEDR